MGCSIFWLGRCDAPHHCLELSAVGWANAVRFRLIHEVSKAAARQRLREG